MNAYGVPLEPGELAYRLSYWHNGDKPKKVARGLESDPAYVHTAVLQIQERELPSDTSGRWQVYALETSPEKIWAFIPKPPRIKLLDCFSNLPQLVVGTNGPPENMKKVLQDRLRLRFEYDALEVI